MSEVGRGSPRQSFESFEIQSSEVQSVHETGSSNSDMSVSERSSVDNKTKNLNPKEITTGAFGKERSPSIEGRGSQEISKFQHVIAKIVSAISFLFTQMTGKASQKSEPIPLGAQLHQVEEELKAAENQLAQIIRNPQVIGLRRDVNIQLVLKQKNEDIDKLEKKMTALKEAIDTEKRTQQSQIHSASPKIHSMPPQAKISSQPTSVESSPAPQKTTTARVEQKVVVDIDKEAKLESLQKQIKDAYQVFAKLQSENMDYEKVIKDHKQVIKDHKEAGLEGQNKKEVEKRTDGTLSNALFVVQAAIDCLEFEAQQLRSR